VITVPSWLLFLVAIWVIAFGAFRLHVARQRKRAAENPDPERPDFRKRGFYAQSPRRHAVFGVLYLMMGAVLVAMGLGWQPPVMGTGCDGGTAMEADPVPERTTTEPAAETAIEVEP
jgi:hypothetical protein